MTSWGRWARKCFFSLRYEEEINKRTAAENDFVVLKKVKGLSPTSHPRAPLGAMRLRGGKVKSSYFEGLLQAM